MGQSPPFRDRHQDAIYSLQAPGVRASWFSQGSSLQVRGTTSSVSGQQKPLPQYTFESLSAGSLRLPQDTPFVPVWHSQKASPRCTREMSESLLAASACAISPNRTKRANCISRDSRGDPIPSAQRADDAAQTRDDFL